MLKRRQFVTLSSAGLLVGSMPALGSKLKHTPYLTWLRPDPGRPNHAFATEFNIVDHGAVGDGKTLNTAAIQQAIEAASKSGGGKVIVPAGKFLTGHVELKSDVELHVTADAVLLGSTDIDDYHRTGKKWYALISAHRAQRLAITGKGKIDGQGLELALDIKDRHLTGKRKTPKFNYRRMRANEAERPQLIECLDCEQVHIYDITLRNAAMWVQTYEQCKDLLIDNIRVDSDAYWNNDGIDIVDCQDVRVTNSFVNAADDAICLKSETPGLANERVLISDCTVRSSASGVKFGTASKGGFKDITVDRITVFDTYRSAIALECVDGGELENVLVTNITASNTGNAIFVRLGHRNKDGQVGRLKNVTIKHVKAEIPLGRPDADYELRGPALNQFFNPIPASITGIPGHHVENVTLEDIEISYPGRASKGMAYVPLNRLDWVPEQEAEYPEFSMFGELPAWALYVRHANGIHLKNIRLTVRDDDFRPAFVFDDVRDLSLKDSVITTDAQHHQVVLRNTHKGVFSGNGLGQLTPDRVQQLEDCSGIREI